MLKMTEICQARDKPKMVQLFFPVLKKPFWLKTILRYFMLQWRSRKNFITSRLCSELIVISLHRACACSLQAYGPKSLSLQALKNTGVWTTLLFIAVKVLSTMMHTLTQKAALFTQGCCSYMGVQGRLSQTRKQGWMVWVLLASSKTNKCVCVYTLQRLQQQWPGSLYMTSTTFFKGRCERRRSMCVYAGQGCWPLSIRSSLLPSPHVAFFLPYIEVVLFLDFPFAASIHVRIYGWTLLGRFLAQEEAFFFKYTIYHTIQHRRRILSRRMVQNKSL